MATALWTLALIYAASVTLLAAAGLAARRSSPFRRFLVGDQALDGASHLAADGWRRPPG